MEEERHQPRDGGHQQVAPVRERRRRGRTDQHVPQEATAQTRDQGQHQHREDVELLADRDQRAGDREDEDAHQVEHDQQRVGLGRSGLHAGQSARRPAERLTFGVPSGQLGSAQPDEGAGDPMKVQDLTLVGLTEDKQKLVLVSDAGEEFTLPADARLRAALRGEHARLGQLEITMDSALRPRDIQARIRAGESPEARRGRRADHLRQDHGLRHPGARRAGPRRRPGAAGLGPAQAPATGPRPACWATRWPSGCAAATSTPPRVEWDAWRREDGRWTLVADYRSGESARHAEFVFDAPGRYVVAEDDEARWLVGEQPPLQGPQPRTGAGAAPAVQRRRPRRRRRAAAGRGRDRDGQRRPPRPRRSRSRRRPAGVEAADAACDRRRGAPTRPARSPSRQRAGADAAAVDDEPRAAEPARAGRARAGPTSRGTAASGARRRAAASVPSWDEIMFGGGKRGVTAGSGSDS